MRAYFGTVALAALGAMMFSKALRGEPLAEAHGEAADIQLSRPDKLKWREGPPSLPKGAMIAVLEGDPSKPGPFVFRIKVPDGYRVRPHTHPKTERITVLSGLFHIGMGDTFDAEATQAMPAGTYGYWPAGMQHFVWTEGETILQFHGMGPWSIQYLNPADDPRNRTRKVPAKTTSGPQVGNQLPGPAYALICVDPQPSLVGTKSELVLDRYGSKPGVLVFARDFNGAVARLLKTMDVELADQKASKNKGKEVHAAAVLLSDDEALESKLKDFGHKRNIKLVTVGIDQNAGPPKWNLNREADVTIIFYEKFKVTRNYALTRDQLNGDTIDTIVADMSTLFGR